MAYSRASSRSVYNQPAVPRMESEQPYVVRLSPAVHSRLVQFFARSENAGLSQSDVIENLLNTTDTSNIGNRREPSTSAPRRRGLVTSHPVQQSLSQRVVTARMGDDDSGDIDYEDGEPGDHELAEEDEELNYGDEYIYEEVIVANETASPETAAPPPADVSAIHNYYYATVSKPDTKSKTTPAVRRATRQGSPKMSAKSQRKQYHPDRKGVGTGKQKPWTSGLRRYIYDLITKWQRDYFLHCRECDRWMKVAHNRSGLRCGNVLDHVCGHVGKPMFACRLCPQQTVTSIQMRKHLQKVHRRTSDFDDLTESCHSELAERITRCFDYSGLGEPPSGTKRLLTCKRKRGEVGVGQMFLNQEVDMNSSSVRRFIYDLIIKWEKENAIYCRHCSHWVRTGSESAWAQAQAALAHVCGHYGKELFACLLCDERTVTYYQMIRHIRHVHQTISRGNCLEQIDDCAADLKEMAAKCFDWEEGTGPPPLTADGPFLKTRRPPVAKKGAQNNRPGSCRCEALEYGRRLIREVAGNSRTMRCQECEVKSVVKSKRGIRPEVLFDHVLKHIDQDAYACPTCSKTAKRKDNMRVHMLSHKGVKPADYIDNTGLIREEIMGMMKRCYDPTCQDKKGEIVADSVPEG